MKHLKSFNESNNTNNESYFELVDILQSKLFDDFDVEKGTDDIIDLFNNISFIILRANNLLGWC